MKKLLFAVLLAQNLANLPPAIITGRVLSPTGTPAAGIRVYAMAVSDSKDTRDSTGTVLESIAQTDEQGRYRLEVPAGRYYIAAGSVDMPTYFPGTRLLSEAKAFSITPATTTVGIDFSQFVPASRTPAGGFAILRPGSTGVVSGVVRYPDGTPAAGMMVALINQTAATAANTRFLPTCRPGAPAPILTSMVVAGGGTLTARQTDATGRYRFVNVAPDTYYIVAGFAGAPVLYPGVSDLAAATTITTNSTTNVDTIDFTVAGRPTGTTIRGRVTAAAGVQTDGGVVTIRAIAMVSTQALLTPSLPQGQSFSRPDGSFEIPNVPPGKYCIEARLAGASPIVRELEVTGTPIDGLQFSFPASVLAGRISWTDGTPFSDAQSIGSVAVTTVSNPNFLATTILDVDSAGKFSRVIEPDDYRFYLRVLPDEYSIESITWNSTDVMKSPLKVPAATAVDIDVRITRRGNIKSDASLSGSIRDAATGGTPRAERARLCCLGKGPFDEFSTAVRPDGTFSFDGVPAGSYTASVHGRTPLLVANSAIDVGPTSKTDVTLWTAPRLTTVPVKVIYETFAPLSGVSVSMSGKAGFASFTAISDSDGVARVVVAAGDEYSFSVIDLPAGLVVKSQTGPVTITGDAQQALQAQIILMRMP